MKVVVDAWAWLPKADLTETQIQIVRAQLSITPKEYPPGEDGPPKPIELFKETETHLGVAREYLTKFKGQNRKLEIELNTTEGVPFAEPLVFNGKLRAGEQTAAVQTVKSCFKSGQLGGIVQAPCGFGKTVLVCALIAELGIPTLVLVHKEFLMNQWMERLKQYLPEARIGVAQQNVCDFEGKHVVVGMIHSVVKGKMPKAFYEWPGLLVSDEMHRISARSWSPAPAMFRAKHRLGVSATPRRKDGTEDVFRYHLGPILFAGKEQRLQPQVKRIFTNFRLVKTPYFNPSLAPESLMLKFLCANAPRNQKIVELMVSAAKTGRKLLIVSKRINHLERLESLFQKEWKESKSGPPIATGYYIGGMTEETRYEASLKQVIFGTSQFCSEGLDIPALDTLFLTVPMSDVEQAVGRILRPFEGKKDPMVVDFRDPYVRMFEGYANTRERIYAKLTA